MNSFHVKTPLIRDFAASCPNSPHLFYKLDNSQPSGSFKIRGIGHMIQKRVESDQAKQIVASSGGNAGAAAAYACHQLNIPATIYVPETTSEIFIKRLENYGAKVHVHGKVWDETDRVARQACIELDSAVYVPPFDDAHIWEGNSSLVDELADQMPGGIVPDCIVASVGGGGLMCGLIEGVVRRGWIEKGVKLVAVETEGADCFNQAVKEDRLVTLPKITSIAKSLGAKTVCGQLLAYYLEYRSNIKSVVVSDKESVQGCLHMLDEQKILVEPSCGCSVTVARNLDRYLGSGHNFKNVVVVICGGSGLSLKEINSLKDQFSL